MAIKTREQLLEEFTKLGESIDPFTKLRDDYNHESQGTKLTSFDVFDLLKSGHLSGENKEEELANLVSDAAPAVDAQRLVNNFGNYSGGIAASTVLDTLMEVGVTFDGDNNEYVLADKSTVSPLGLVDKLHSFFEGKSLVSTGIPSGLEDYVSSDINQIFDGLREAADPTDTLPSTGDIYHTLNKAGVIAAEDGWYSARDLKILSLNDHEISITSDGFASKLTNDQVYHIGMALLTPTSDGNSRIVSQGDVAFPLEAQVVVEEDSSEEPSVELTVPKVDLMPEYTRMANYLEEDGELFVRTGRFFGHKELDPNSMKEFVEGSMSPVRLEGMVADGDSEPLYQWSKNGEPISTPKAEKLLAYDLQGPRHRAREWSFDEGTLSRKIVETPLRAASALLKGTYGVLAKHGVKAAKVTGVAIAVVGSAYVAAEAVSEHFAKDREQAAYISELEENQRPDYGADLIKAETVDEVKSIVDSYVVLEGQDIAGTSRAKQGFTDCINNPLKNEEGLLSAMTMYGTSLDANQEKKVLGMMENITYTFGPAEGKSYFGGDQICTKLE